MEAEMEMRIVVSDAAGGSTLAEGLSAAFGADRISRRGDRLEVGIRFGRSSERQVVLRVLDAVEGWLDRAGAGSAVLRLGTHSYRVARSAPVESWQHPRSDPLGLDDLRDGGARADRGEARSPSIGRERSVIRDAHPSTAGGRPSDGRSDYWLEHSEGFQVFGPNGRIGFVARVLSSGGVGGLVIRTGLFRTRSVVVPVREVRTVAPRRQRLELLVAPRVPRQSLSEFVRELVRPSADSLSPWRDEAAPAPPTLNERRRQGTGQDRGHLQPNVETTAGG